VRLDLQHPRSRSPQAPAPLENKIKVVSSSTYSDPAFRQKTDEGPASLDDEEATEGGGGRMGGILSAIDRNRRDVISVAGITILGLLLRIAYLVFGTGKRPLWSDSAQYFEIAKNMAAGRGFSMQFPGLFIHETAFRPPGYPLLLSGFFAVFGTSAGLARAINVVLGLVVITLTFVVVRRYVGFVAAAVAGLAVAVAPNLIANDTYVLDEPLSLCLLLLLIWSLLARRWWAAGATCGLLILTRPSAQFLIVALVIWLFFRADWRAVLRVVLVAIVVVSPWIVRNWIQLGEPIMVTSNGFNWAAIYSPTAQKSGGFIDPVQNHAYDRDRLLQFDELAWSNTLQTQGIKALEAHPTYIIHVIKNNFSALSEYWPAANDAPDLLDGRDLRVVHDTLWFFYLEVGIGIFGLIVARRTQIAELFIIESAYFGFASVLFVAVPRLRAPLDLSLAVGAGLAADYLVRFRERRASPSTEAIRDDLTGPLSSTTMS